MPVPKYVKKNKRKEYERKHKRIVKAITGKVNNPNAVATKELQKQYKPKKRKKKR